MNNSKFIFKISLGTNKNDLCNFKERFRQIIAEVFTDVIKYKLLH